MILPVSLLFHNIGHNLAQILPQDHTQFDFFAGFQWNMLRNSITIKKFNYNPVVLKNFATTSKDYYFSAQLGPKLGSSWATPKTKIIRNNKNQILSFQNLFTLTKYRMF